MEFKRQHGYTSLISSEAGMNGVFSAFIGEGLAHHRVGDMFQRGVLCVLFFSKLMKVDTGY